MRAGNRRAGMGLVVALAAAAAGCQGFTRSLGLYEKTAEDQSHKNTKPGDYAIDDRAAKVKVKVVKFDIDTRTAPGSVNLELLNEGSPQEFIAFDVEFGYPAPADAIAPYIPEFVEITFENWESGKTKPYEVKPITGSKVPPLFARIVSVSGKDVRRTAARETPDTGLRRGTVFLNNRVEVVKIEANLSPPEGTKATMAFTLESTADADVGNLRYMVQFYKDGKPMDLGRSFRSFKPAGKPLGKRGDRVVVDVALDPFAGLATSQPVLRVVQ